MHFIFCSMLFYDFHFKNDIELIIKQMIIFFHPFFMKINNELNPDCQLNMDAINPDGIEIFNVNQVTGLSDNLLLVAGAAGPDLDNTKMVLSTYTSAGQVSFLEFGPVSGASEGRSAILVRDNSGFAILGEYNLDGNGILTLIKTDSQGMLVNE